MVQRFSSCGVPASEIAVPGLSSWGAQTLEHAGSVEHGLSCSVAYGILITRPGLNPHPLHCQVDS